MRYKRHRRHDRKQGRILIVSIICLIFIMAIGYAAFSTNINITAQGNILMKRIAIDDLKSSAITSGEGLYKDSYEENRYIYRGANPNNYIEFNNELWRIIAIENDNSLKIIRNSYLPVNGNKTSAWDSQGRRSTDNNSYCTASASYGCNAWTTSDNYINGTVSGQVTQNAEINDYLNINYYNSLLEESKNNIINYNFRIGGVKKYVSTSEIVSLEKAILWNGKVGLINVSDYLKSTLSTDCDPTTEEVWTYNSKITTCKNNNYLYDYADMWTINSLLNTSYRVIDIYERESRSGYGNLNGYYAAYSTERMVYPVVFLNSNIILTGEGTENNPYKILNE